MPPRAKFTKEEIVETALRIVEREGLAALTARSLGAALGSSARPIFTVFDSMDDVLYAVNSRAKEIYGKYIEEGLREAVAFRGVGKAYIRFAAERPRLFRLLFMREQPQILDKYSVLQGIEEHYDAIIDSIVSGYDVDRPTALDLYWHLWVYSHGIAVLLATQVCAFTDEQISEMLSSVFAALMKEKMRNRSA